MRKVVQLGRASAATALGYRANDAQQHDAITNNAEGIGRSMIAQLLRSGGTLGDERHGLTEKSSPHSSKSFQTFTGKGIVCDVV